MLPPKHIHYVHPAFRDSNVNGINYRVDISDLVGWYAYWGFQFESRQRLYSLIKPTSVFIDVGANLGEVSLNAARIVGPKGQVYSFEPFPSNFIKLETNIALNQFENIIANNCALGNRKGIMPMIAPEVGNAGMNRIDIASISEDCEMNVSVIPLDDFVDERNLSRIDVIKIDVEGFEMNVLLGSLRTIKLFRPKLFIEVIDQYLYQNNTSALAIVELLESLNYSLIDAETGQKVSSGRLPSSFQYDLIGLPLELEQK